jgi:hypothetical protein
LNPEAVRERVSAVAADDIGSVASASSQRSLSHLPSAT